MTALAKNTRRFAIWILVAVLLAGLGAISALLLQRKKTLRTPVAAYLLPFDNDSRVQLSWWPAKKIDHPLTLHSGEPAVIPNGAKIKLVHADTGKTEDIAGPAKIILQQKLPNETESLTSPLEEVSSATKTIKLPQSSGPLFTSPVGVTRYLNPLITWTAQDGKTYDIAVLDPADPYVPPRVATNIRPPVALADLETPQRRQLSFDRNYEIIIRESGTQLVAGEARFLTASDAQPENQLPTTPTDLIAEACAAMARKPYRTGDAWLALSHLPTDWAKSELGIRLRLRVATELFSSTELASANEDAAKIMRHR